MEKGFTPVPTPGGSHVTTFQTWSHTSGGWCVQSRTPPSSFGSAPGPDTRGVVKHRRNGPSGSFDVGWDRQTSYRTFHRPIFSKRSRPPIELNVEYHMWVPFTPRQTRGRDLGVVATLPGRPVWGPSSSLFSVVFYVLLGPSLVESLRTYPFGFCVDVSVSSNWSRVPLTPGSSRFLRPGWVGS